MAAAISRMLRGADILARYDDDEFVVVLTQTDASAAAVVASRIADAAVELYGDCSPSERPTFGFATAPEDGKTLASLVATSRQRQQPLKVTTRPPAVH
jgi:diguanylate cyclase (GGDEF)-like protein